MIYKKYGQTFKQLRTQKKIKLNHFENLGISSSALCKFENGYSMLKFEKLIPALEKLSITLHEYENFLNNWQDSKSDALIQNVKTAVMINDLKALPNFYQEALEMDEFFLALSIKNCYSALNDLEIEKLIDYLEEIKLWRYIDLFTLYLSLDFLKPSQIPFIIENFYLTNNEIFNSYEENNKLAEIVCQATMIFISSGYKELSDHFLKYLWLHQKNHSMYVRNFYFFVRGYWISEFEQKDKGINCMKHIIKILEFLDYPNIANYYKQLYKKYSKMTLR
ncbi:Rgg/GadR/MutR family transcriptional regulator [Lactococcus lactis]|uniref:Rgg/GadR/MutR family transcriptional regulator n=1 Tax=Lactococcus lactis TaxID=1358 RepID=UPI001F595A81|nr:Rgg/GadR/MutR family transcriptional regulator [Lactococcus lactis]